MEDFMVESFHKARSSILFYFIDIIDIVVEYLTTMYLHIIFMQ